MKCTNCGYYWTDDGENYGTCHFERRFPDDYAPCEQEDIDIQREWERAEEEDERRRIEEECRENEDTEAEIMGDETLSQFEKLKAIMEYEGVFDYGHRIAQLIKAIYDFDLEN